MIPYSHGDEKNYKSYKGERMTHANRLGLNRIIQPGLSITEFIKFAADCDFAGIELRNDLEDSRVLGGERAADIIAVCHGLGIDILTINALQRFNDPALFEQKKEELLLLMAEAEKVGCKNIVLCPVNDPKDARGKEQQREDLVQALKTYGPLFEKKNMVGFIEPLGFPICSVRYKQEAVAAIQNSGFDVLYRIVHDTFHHFLSEEKQVFPEWTGMVHISGVYAGKKKDAITDDDRVLVDAQDIMDNKNQITRLLDGGCDAPISFEPFSSSIQKLGLSELKQKLTKSIHYIFNT